MHSFIHWGRGVWLLLWVVSGLSAQAMFGWQETQLVPMDRLVVNLERKLAANTNDPTVLYQLARLHSMRGATLSNAMDVAKTSAEPVFAHPGFDTGIPALTNALANPQWQTQSRTHFTNALGYYDRALRALAKSTNAMDRWNLLPARLGYAWTLDQAGQTHAALREYRLVLNEAWASEMQVSLGDWWEQLRIPGERDSGSDVRNAPWVPESVSAKKPSATSCRTSIRSGMPARSRVCSAVRPGWRRLPGRSHRF